MINYDYHNTFDRPIVYRDFSFYHVELSNYYDLYWYAECFQFEKDYIPEQYKVNKDKILEYAKIMQKPDLDFMYFVSDRENLYVQKFYEIMKLATRNDNLDFWFGYDENGIAIFKNKETGEIYNSSDFEKIREIISNQNDIELIDYKKSKAFRDAEKRSADYKRKSSKSASLEDLMISLSVFTGWKLEDVYSLSIRKFKKMIERADAKLHYEIYLSASMSGMVEFKDKSFIKHWLSDLGDTSNSGFVETDSVQKKISKSK